MKLSPNMTNNNSISPILLVEDRAVDLDLTKRAFARRRVLNPIQEARDGEEALAYIDRWDQGEPLPVFILLDLKLPKLDGLEVLRRLKGHASYANIPVVVLTTSAEDRDVEQAYKLGCNSYIVKPVEFDKFMDVAELVEVYWCAVNTPPR
ncbi:MAG TPA: response regulator [Pyrinomonadaceae bacterium]|nr:response regulator [Pyrinomonadaceae bacterium]